MTNFLAELPRYFEGADDTTPPGCTVYVTKVFDIPTTYLLRDGEVIGRIEHPTRADAAPSGYVGSAMKGGTFVGTGDFKALAEKIAERTKGK